MKIPILLISIFCSILTVNGGIVKTFLYFDGNNRPVTQPDSKLPLKIIVHGWNNFEANGNSWSLRMKDAILENERIPKTNVLIVNWNSNILNFDSTSDFFTSKLYVSSAENCETVGQEIVNELKRVNYRNDVHCIGHSLGAHVCGFAGQIAKTQLVAFKRISGLDPAEPYFKTKPINQRLDQTDADFVDIYHTNNGALGISFNIGHADYYPNDSSRQPGCATTFGILNLNIVCSHGRAYEYFIESIKNRTCFTVYYKAGPNTGKKASVLYGYWAEKSSGEYTCTTQSTAPFCSKP